MPLLGKAAMLLSFDIVADAIAAHDDWHTHEHMHERLSIPGFLRGSRWIAVAGEPTYCVLYEVRSLEVLTSAAYLERLNNPTPWTSKVMPSYRRMTRGLCAVTGSFGLGMGHACALVRLKPQPGREVSLRKWLLEEALPPLPSRLGMVGVHLLEGAVAAPMTREQSIRGADTAVDWALFLTGYDREALESVCKTALGSTLAAHDYSTATYRLDYSLTEQEAKR